MPVALTPQSAIDSALTYFEGVTADDFHNARNRAQLLILLQGVMDELENDRNLKFQYKTGSVTLLQGTSSIAPPNDFKEIGEEGSIWIEALNRELRGPRLQQEIFKERLLDGSTPKQIYIYGLWDGLIQTAVADADTVLTVNYVRMPTALSDDTTALLLPANYHYSVLLPGLLGRCNMVKDELRESMANLYERNKAKMYVRERARRGDTEELEYYAGALY